MLAVQNETPFEVALVPGQDKEGRDFATVLIKGTFTTSPGRESPAIAEKQVPVLYADEHHGEPDSSSVRIEADTAPANGSTDVALLGHAYTEPRDRTVADVRLVVGPVCKDLRVFGDRVWLAKSEFSRATKPTPFEKVALIYERAFGGRDTSPADQTKHGHEARNPVGRGFAVSGTKRSEDLPLPNIEDPRHLIRSVRDGPPPAGFGFIARAWQPRAAYAGTYDEAWENERKPLLPLDFDERFYSGAHPDLIATPALQGGEEVRATGVSKQGAVTFRLPRPRLECLALVNDEFRELQPVMSRVLLEPDENRVVINWKARVDCPRQLLYLRSVTVRAD